MKKTILSIFLGLFFYFNAQAQSSFMNGWEFLEWGMSTAQVEKLLAKNGLSYTPLSPNAKLRATKAQNYKGFERLVFMYDEGALVQVQLYHQTNNRGEANRFIDKLIADYTQTHGEPLTEEKTEAKQHWAWQIGQSTVSVYLNSPPSEADGEYETQVFFGVKE